jgi:hypothetical protein
MKVALFMPCYIDQFYPRIVVSNNGFENYYKTDFYL